MRRRTPAIPPASFRPSARRPDHAGERRRAVVREVTTVMVLVVGVATVLAFDPAADDVLDLGPASSGEVVPAVLPAAAAASTTVRAVTTPSGPTDPGALVAAREQAVADAEAQLAAEAEAARLAEERAAQEAAAAAAAERAAVWDRLADCESGAWDRDGHPIPGTATWDYGLHPSQDGFFQGGLQFHPVTWDEFRDADMPDHAGSATRSQQIAIAERVLDAQGWEAWPVCSKKLGYR
ncbi:MAG: transglycosylase family protein [Actinobacteria bacterium]|nr:transglycosylase family protein [Actinomycetota bacterium]